MGCKCHGNQRAIGYIKTIKLNNSRNWNSDLPNPTERTKMAEKIRLNKFISDSGVCSRREADKFIETGKVLVNGHRAVVGELVSGKDKVMLNGQRIEAKVGDEFVFLAFNKPVGVISTTEIGVKDSIIDYIGYHERIFPIGRLDKESQGLIFMTNNGDIVNKILRAGNNHEKEYLVTVNKPITDDFITRMGNGVPMLGETTKKCKVTKESVYTFRIVLVQGLNRQIRRMCEYFEYEVTKLERVRIMNINLKGIPTGEWRPLTPHEMTEIMGAIANSSSTAEPSKTKEQGQKTKDAKPKNPGSGAARPAQRSSAAKQMDRATNPNPKSKALRGQGSAAPADKRYSGAKSGRGGSAGKSNASSKGFSNKR
jgi:23S rRNA pseudouridine2604 synthase